MAIVKRKTKRGTAFQVKVKGVDGRWITETHYDAKLAKKRELELSEMKEAGLPVKSISNSLTLSQYFGAWHEHTKDGNTSAGWRNSQIQMFNSYIHESVGTIKLRQFGPAHVQKVLNGAKRLGRSPQTCLHLYNLMHKMFEDAVELFEIMQRNPVLKTLKPRVPTKESKYLNPDEARALLGFVRGKAYGVAIWLQVLVGMRIGEVQALKWENVDFKGGRIYIRSTYLRKEGRFQDYPKGKRWHTVVMPPDLVSYLRIEKVKSVGEFVATSPSTDFLSYHSFYDGLRKYCRLLGLPSIGTHALRHSASELYMQSGASRDDLRILFNHSSSAVTDRYVHDKGERLKSVAKLVRVTGH
ncbi:MAG: tyrosine-type recombinase/integrase [Pseudobdellovibrionaceae bacterium]|nr:tyrosine-type recombinase/integrase [Bdellovibrionales bacterium]USN47110.1 MAG: tyrosine-type recombinase/integrase [Pseudobdellovibrionaceae bacterium]